MPTPVILEIKVNKQQAITDLRVWSREVNRTFGEALAEQAKLNKGFGSLALNPDGVHSGTKSALGDLRELNGAIKDTRENLKGLSSQKLFPRGILSGGMLADSDRATKALTGSFQRSAEQQKRLDDSLMASKYRNLQVSGAQYREYLTQRLGEEKNSVQQSIRLNNELADLQIDAMRRVTAALREEEQKRVGEARQAAQQQAIIDREASGGMLAQRGGRISSIGSGMRSVGQAMTWGYSAPVVAGVGYALKSAISREDATADIAKVFPQETADRIAQVRKELEALSHELPISYSALAALANQGGQMGVPIEGLKEYVKVAAELGLVTDMSADQATIGLAKIAAAMDLNISNGPEAGKTFHDLAEQLGQMGIEGSASGSEIVDLAQRIASAGKNAGMTSGDIFSLANGLTSLGQNAEAGGTAAMRTVTMLGVAVATNSKRLKEFAEISGVSVADFKKMYQTDALGALLKFSEGLHQLGEEGQKPVALLTEMGIKGSGQMIMLQNLSNAYSKVAQYRVDVNRAEKDGNVIETSTAKKTQDAASQLKIMENRSEELAAKLGLSLLPSLLKLAPEFTHILDDISRLVDKFDKLPKPVKDATLEFLAISVVAGPVVTGLGNVLTIVGSVTRGIAALKALKTASEIKDIVTALSGIEGGAGSAGGAVNTLTTNLTGLKKLLLTPVGAARTLGGLLFGTGIGTAAIATALPLALGGVLTKGIGGTSSLDQEKRLWALSGTSKSATGGPSGSSAYVDVMLDKAKKGIVESGLQCGSAITEALHETGIQTTATALRDRARKDPRFREAPIGQDSLGNPRYHEGTIFFFPPTQGGEQHFATAHTDPATNRQYLAEYTKSGTGEYHYSDSRQLVTVLAEHGGRAEAFNASLFGNNAKTQQAQQDAQSDLVSRLYEATHTEFQNKRYEAYQTYKDDQKTDPAKAKALLLATLKQIDRDEADEQKKHEKETEDQQKAHLARLQAKQKAYWEQMGAAQKAALKQEATAADARTQMRGHIAALADPDSYAYDMERTAAHAKYAGRMKALGGSTLGPYSVQQQKDFEAAQQELTASLADIAQRQGQKAKDQAAQDAEEVAGFQKQATADQTELNREVWQHAGGDMAAYFKSLRDEADAALAEVQTKYGAGSKTPNAAAVTAAQGVHDARLKVIGQQQADDAKAAQEKMDEAQAESVRFEYEQHLVSLAQYQAYLRQKLALTQQYETRDDQKNGVLSRNWMQVKGELDASLGETKAKPKLQGLVGGQPFWDGLADSASEQGSRVLDALFNPKDKKNIFKSMWTDLLQSGEDSLKSALKTILKNTLTGGATGLLGGLLGGRKSAGAAMPGSNLPLDLAAKVLGNGGTAIPMSQSGMSQSGMAGMMGMRGLLGAGGLFGAGAGGLGTDPGMSAGGGASSLLGAAGMFGSKGLLGGLFSHGGLFNASGSLGGLGAAMPWIGGGLMLNSLLGNPLGKVFKNIGKIFHFSQGGVVPGAGSGDIVPAMLTPGEVVIPKAIAHDFTPHISLPSFANAGRGSGAASSGREGAGVSQVVVHQYGDHQYSSEMDIHKVKEAWAKDMQKSRRAGIPVT